MTPDWQEIPGRPGYYVMTDSAWSRLSATLETAASRKRVRDMIQAAIGDTSKRNASNPNHKAAKR